MPPELGPDREREGLAVFEALQEEHFDLPVVFLSAFDDLPTVNRALTRGGFWYLKKPPDLNETKAVLGRALEERKRRLNQFDQQRLKWLRSRPRKKAGDKLDKEWGFQGQSQAVVELRQEVTLLAPTRIPVFLFGETGIGKEVLAKDIHRFSGRRGNFVAINCNELRNPALASDRLFGHSKGAFTGATSSEPGAFELADKGTLFLDEISDLEWAIQGMLLRVLQEGEVQRLGVGEDLKEVDVRVLAASHRNLHDAVERGEFREDLFFRLAQEFLNIPPLRERPEDIPVLCDWILRDIWTELGSQPVTISQSGMEMLKQHHWRGNVRELQAVLRKAVLRAKTCKLDASLIDRCLSLGIKAPSKSKESESDIVERILAGEKFTAGVRKFRDQFGEFALRDLLSRVIRQTRSVKSAGEWIGFIRPETFDKDFSNLRFWMKQLGLKRKDLLRHKSSVEDESNRDWRMME